MAEKTPTRQRLLDAGLRLFAEHGFEATSVGDIEAAAGLQPRRGALYKHFPSKQALLEVAVRAKLDDAEAVARQAATIDLSSVPDDEEALGDLAVALGRWFLDEVDRLETITRVFEHDAHRFTDLVDDVRTNLVDLSYRSVAELIRRTRPAVDDPDAAAVVVLAPLVAIRRTQWTYGDAPLGIDDDRLLAQWARHTLTALGGA